MRGYVERCSAISRLFSIGKSVEGRDLWALEISTRPGLEQAKPSFKYVANMHGDEPSGRCLLLPNVTVENLRHACLALRKASRKRSSPEQPTHVLLAAEKEQLWCEGVHSWCRQLLLALAEWLCANHAADERAKRVVEDMHLFILPSMNPDGFERRQRGNARQVTPRGLGS